MGSLVCSEVNISKRGNTVLLIEKLRDSLFKIIFVVMVSGCTSIPATTLEKSCIRTYIPSEDFRGQSFIINDDLELSSLYLRFNKSMWANYNRFTPKTQILGKKATILCYESVPGPGNILQNVISLNIEGVKETVYATHRANDKVRELKKHQNYEAQFKSEIGRKLWAKVDYPFTTVSLQNKEGDTSLRNLEEVTVHDIVFYKQSRALRINNNYVRVHFKTASGLIVSKVYSTQLGVTQYTLDWHVTNPRTTEGDWPESIWDKIESSEVIIGMTSQMISLAIGDPDDVTITETGYGRGSVWSYNSITGLSELFYFENGVLVAIQKL